MNFKKTLLITGIFCLSTIPLLSGCNASTASAGSADSTSSEVPGLNGFLTALNATTDVDTIYTSDYQTSISEQIQDLKSENTYTSENPLVIANPYGTNTTSLYIYFQTDTAVQTSYTVSADGYEDYSRTLTDDCVTEHEYLLTGIVPDTNNQIVLSLQNDTGTETDTLELQYDAPSPKGSSDNIQLDVIEGDSTASLSDGLYAMLGNRTDEDNEQVDFILLYDNYGTLRSEIPIKSYRACNILFDDDSIYFSTSANEIAVMNQLGKITKIYDMDNYQLHHDYIWGSQEDILVLASEQNCLTEEDRILSVDLETGHITELIDLRALFDGYFETLEVNGTADDPFDWIHINSIRMMDDDSIIISSRETSSIIKISQIYTEPTVDYIIGSSQFWEESGYDELVYTPVGEFSLNAGQHCVEYETSDNLEEGQYYLYFFNNNNATISTRDYDYSADSNYDGTYCGVNGDESYYDKYLVDENARTFELAERIPVTYSGYVSSVQHLGDNILIDSGSAFTAVELDENNEPIQTLVGTGDTWWYRVFKWEFN